MESALETLKRELERFGEETDSTATDRAERMLNITRDTGEFLSVLVRATAARDILEVGTSNGYSTLWLAEAASANNGFVTTVEYATRKQELALENFARSGMSERIRLIPGDAGKTLGEMEDASMDLVFLDSDRSQYLLWWKSLKPILRPGGLLVVDNATSHQKELESFIKMLCADPDFCTSLVPVGKGEFLATKSRAGSI